MAFAATQIPTTAGQVAAATSVNKALTSNPTSGSVVLVTFLFYDGTTGGAGTVTITDGNSNSYAISANSPSIARGNAGAVYFAYLIAPANAEKTITCNFTNTSLFASLWVQEYGVSGGTAAFSSDIAGTGASGTAINTPTVTAAGANTLMVTAALSDHQVSTVDSPWVQIAAGLGNQLAEGIGYILAASSNTAAAMTQNVTSGWDSMGIAFAFTATPATTDNGIKSKRPNRPAPFKPMGDAFRPGVYKDWR